jgi:hypothetical protein
MPFANHSGTKCPKCSSSSFTLVEDFPSNANFKMYYIRCSSCNSFLQALPYYDTNSKIEQLQEDIDKIKRKLSVY